MTSPAPADPRSPFDWNCAEPRPELMRPGVTFLDETLRDGIQNPSVVDPCMEDKLELLHLMDQLGIDYVNVGLPASSTRNRDDSEAACREIAQSRLRIRPVAAGRTVVGDLTPILDISDRAGIPVEVYTFIGSSPIRQLAETWDVAALVKRSAAAIDAAVRSGLPVAYVTEDTTRSRPETLRTLWTSAIDHGVSRLCLADTVGHATPAGVKNLIQFAQGVIAESGATVGLDWHGHNDRGLALDNALSALEYGADRIHGTALGIGERTGNPPMELILLNLGLLGERSDTSTDLLIRYSRTAARSVCFPVPPQQPLVGRDAAQSVRDLEETLRGRLM